MWLCWTGVCGDGPLFCGRVTNVHHHANTPQVLGERGKFIKIISKVENQEGIQNFDEILAKTDSVMVRGAAAPPRGAFPATRSVPGGGGRASLRQPASGQGAARAEASAAGTMGEDPMVAWLLPHPWNGCRWRVATWAWRSRPRRSSWRKR